MAHVELSFTEPLIPPVEAAELPSEPVRSLDRWAMAAADAVEACLVINELYDIVAVSPAAARLLGCADPQDLVRRNLMAGPIPLVDFNTRPRPLPQGEIEKTPPVMAHDTGRLARGLLRVEANGTVITLDAIATPLIDAGQVVGSLTFLADLTDSLTAH